MALLLYLERRHGERQILPGPVEGQVQVRRSSDANTSTTKISDINVWHQCLASMPDINILQMIAFNGHPTTDHPKTMMRLVTGARCHHHPDAKGGTRTPTPVRRQILSLVRLPIPPLSLTGFPLKPK
jgi:hypothetical protein